MGYHYIALNKAEQLSRDSLVNHLLLGKCFTFLSKLGLFVGPGSLRYLRVFLMLGSPLTLPLAHHFVAQTPNVFFFPQRVLVHIG